MRDAESALERLCDPAAEVSCHYLIGRDGRCWQLVEESERAWHAGAGSWVGAGDVNSRSIGIELDNDGTSPFSEPLMSTLEGLLPAILARWRIPPHGVIGHSDMSPGRKIDPGGRFDWRRLARRGLACWPDGQGGTPRSDAPADISAGNAFRQALVAFGYPADISVETLLAAFRARFRPWGRGALDEIDLALARDLAARFGVDPEALTT